MTELLQFSDQVRREASATLAREKRAALGQFLTPASIAAQMAAMLEDLPTEVRALDAGAGTGSLIAALCDELRTWARPPDILNVRAYEIDRRLQPYLQDVLARCESALRTQGVRFSHQLLINDFIADAVAQLQGAAPPAHFNCALVNPPYGKLRSDSVERQMLRTVGIETSNLYTAFLALIVKLLEPGGLLCAITPRSFCNGPYFLPFRRLLMDSMTLRRIHEFTARDVAFREDAVLQETVIFTAVKRSSRTRVVLLSQSSGELETETPPREVPYEAVLQPNDPERVIHLPRNLVGAAKQLPMTLAELGVSVSTGRVVDFRAKAALRVRPTRDTVPLLHPVHLRQGRVYWPLSDCRKAQYIVNDLQTEALLFPAGCYVLVKRFSSKEQRRRVTAALCLPEHIANAQWLGIENHLNVLFRVSDMLPESLARGLCVFLNSTILDEAFRQFSGHTQVNAMDLRRLRFPSRKTLEILGKMASEETFATQEGIDSLVAKNLS